jgi:predicted lipid-binding transport protein (Tim44 family)
MGNNTERRTARRRAAVVIGAVGFGFAAGGTFGFLHGGEAGGLMVGTLVGAAMSLGGAFVATAAVGFRTVATSLAVLLGPRDDAAAGDYDDTPPNA